MSTAEPATWLITRGEGEGGTPFRVGETLRAHWWIPPADPDVADEAKVPGAVVSLVDGRKRVSGIVTVELATFEELTDDDELYGAVSADDGRVYLAQVRAATPEEAFRVLLQESGQQRRDALAQGVAELFCWGVPTLADVTCPRPAPLMVLTLPEVPLGRGTDEHASGRLRVDRPAGLVWTVVPASEGDPEAGNCGPNVALAHPLTPARRQLVDDLGAEYSVWHAWSAEDGYELRAAEMLTAAGWTREALHSGAGALSMHTEHDARVFLAKPFGWWTQHGWGARVGGYGGVPAAEAVQLADAGVTCQWAGELHYAGFADLDAKLAARPPRLPTTGGRFVLFAGTPASSAVTDSPAAAQAFADAHPAVWRRCSHTPGVWCVHATRYWQVWSDGGFSFGLWLPDSRPALPSTAAEVLGLVVAALNGSLMPRAVRKQLFAATAHEAVTVNSGVNPAERLVSEVALVRHEVTSADGTVVFWRVLSADGGRIDASTEHLHSASIHLEETSARAEFADQCGKRGIQ